MSSTALFSFFLISCIIFFSAPFSKFLNKNNSPNPLFPPMKISYSTFISLVTKKIHI
uniref:ATP synthase subunit 8 n=1 Tax=Coleolaelaps cf. liui XFX-2019 TaxID=2695870 RepID=A0A6B9WCH6_9ACAR|nr:ATP synthase subunit 8 [Coleolaelaps cf. liui XFX-2019]